MLHLLCKTILLKISYLIIILWISLEKGECFDVNHSLRCAYPTLYNIRLLGRVYHFNFMICYPCSFNRWNTIRWYHFLHQKCELLYTATKFSHSTSIFFFSVLSYLSHKSVDSLPAKFETVNTCLLSNQVDTTTELVESRNSFEKPQPCSFLISFSNGIAHFLECFLLRFAIAQIFLSLIKHFRNSGDEK